MNYGTNYTDRKRANNMPDIKTVPNQRVISVNKAIADKQHLYTVINLQALNAACRTLQSKAGVKLYLYLAKNQDRYTFALSSADFMEWAGVKIGAYNTAFKELVNSGFLQPIGNNHYSFYESGNHFVIADNPDKEKKTTQEGTFVY